MTVAELIRGLEDHDEDARVLLASDRVQHNIDFVTDAEDEDGSRPVYLVEGSHPPSSPYSPGETRA